MNDRSHSILVGGGGSLAEERLLTDARRGQIARAALEIITAGGVEALSMASVAERCGIVPSAIYRHFRGRDEMVAAAVDHVVSRARANVREAVTSSGGALDALERLLYKQLELVDELVAIPRILFAAGGGPAGNPAFRKKLRRMLSGLLGELEKLIRRGQEAGEIRRDVNPGVAARMYWGLLPTATILTIHFGRDFARGEFSREAWKVVRRSLEA
ncbi:MAG: TetR/AcrR family transcriptional regulator [bacterium]